MSRTLPLLAALIAGALSLVAVPARRPSRTRPSRSTSSCRRPRPECPVRARGASTCRRRCSAPKRFNVVGLRWRGPRRAHAPAGAGDAATAGAGPRGASSRRRAPRVPTAVAASAPPAALSGPAWAGQADWVQYRSERRLPGARLHFVNTTGTATAADRLRTARQRTIRAAGTQPAMVSREGWGAQNCPPRSAPDYGEVKLAFVHHTVNLNDYSREEAPVGRARHLPLPPQLERVERHRLQLPRRQVRDDLRGSGRRRRRRR